MRYIKRILEILSKLLEINWFKTIYFNFRKFPLSTARKLPVFFYGKVLFTDISGNFIIEGPINRGMIGFGKNYVMNKAYSKISELNITGTIVFKGYVQFGKDFFVNVNKNAILEMGHMSSLGTKGKIICTNLIVFGNYARIGSESQLIDTNFHQMIDTETGEIYPKSAPIVLGNYNFISNRVTLLSKTKTPNYCTIASNSLCSKDYTSLGENILIGGMPAKLLKNNITRDWKGEEKLFEYLKRIF